MRGISTAAALVAGLLSQWTLSAQAAPSPKIPSIRNPRLFTRPPVDDYFVAPKVEPVILAPSTTTAPKKNIWISLSDEEAASVVKFLHTQKDLNLTAAADAGTWDNWISVIDLAQPNKTEALAYLAGGPVPARYAKATLSFYATDEPYSEDFLVGPLPVSNQTVAVPYDYRTTKGSSKIRIYDADGDAQYTFYNEVAATVSDIVEDLFNKTYDSLDIWGIDPLWHEAGGRIIIWVTFFIIPSTVFDGETLLPQGLFFKLDITGRDPSKWSLVGWLYGGVYYTSTADFRAAWVKGLSKGARNEEGDWIGSDQTGTAPKLDKKAPPLQVQPDGERFTVDEDNKYVEWMDFSFYITFTRDTGMKFFDIKYRGETVVYELGLQEAIAHYAGNDPVQSGTAYLDTYYGFGPYAFELVRGYDVPEYAHCLSATFHAEEVSTTHREGICLYESDAGYLMQRHSSQNYVSATKNIMFSVRSVSTVGNYDYTFTYNFYLDGSIETVVQASGYIQAAYYYKNDDYGYHIHKGLSGSMHDHSLNFKADLDILGTKNTLATHTVKAADVKYPWSNTTRSTMKLVRGEIETEDEGKINWSANGQTMLVVVNKNETNPFGEPRGYRIMPSRGGAGMHLTITNSSNLVNSQGFGTHALYVTKQHDFEQNVAHAMNDADPYHPIVDFSKFFNNESLVQEDIVLWFNLGMHHTPHTGDLPNTVMTTAQAGIIISPHNYLLNDASRVSSQAVRLNYNSSADNIVSQVLTFGHEDPSGTVNLTSLQTDFYTYMGDVNVRKFPYDPLHPYNETESIV